MQTLDIECPSCGEMLELDAGFAGGVCRCSSCGTLMTVPSDAGKAESLMRPAGSESFGSMSGLDGMGVPDPGPRRERSSTTRHKKAKSSKSKAKSKRPASANTTLEAGEYRTASGKVIRLDKPTRVPMAEGKRKQIRRATAVVFFSVIALVVVAAAAVILAVISSSPGPGGQGGSNGAAVYDPAANPYTLTFANVMGLPVTDRTIVVVEASEYSAEWSAFAGDMLAAGLSESTQDAPNAEIAFVGAGGEPVVFTGSAPPIEGSKVTDWFGELLTEADADMAAGIEAALNLNPDTLIVMTGDADSTDIDAWDALIDGKKDLALHAVFIGNSSLELQGWVGERGGELVVLSIQDIETLKELASEE